MDATRFFPDDAASQPASPAEDVARLHEWAGRIATWLQSGRPPNRHLLGILAPARGEHAALLRLSAAPENARLVAQLREAVAEVRQTFAAWQRRPDDNSEDALAEDGEWLLDTLEAVTAILAGRAAPPQDASEAEDERDGWIYRQVIAGRAYKAILRELRKHPEWDGLETVEGVRKAARRYADHHRLPRPPSRHPGRPRKYQLDG